MISMSLLNRCCSKARLVAIAFLLVTGWLPRLAFGADKPDAAGERFFESRIRPVLIQHCYACHSARAKSLEAGLRLDHRQGIRQGGESGPAVVPGDAEKSLLINALRYQDYEMPPKKQLAPKVIDDFVKWIEMGAPDPRTSKAIELTGIDIEASRSRWPYRPVVKPAIPGVSGETPGSAIDAFILSRLEEEGLRQGKPASRTVLVRRLYFDLLGIPPSPEEIDRFLEDPAPDAYDRLVDRLLSSPRFGERWGRHWLDVARYAESIALRGFVFPEAWRYRDYVIQAFNEDRPFDDFVKEQISGDLLPAATLPERRRNLVATTLLTMGNNNLEDQDKGKLRMDVVDEQLETIGRGFLGQTIGCARCHDHKFDPIPTRDYYALAGILRNTKTLNHANVSKWIELPLPLSEEREALLKQQEVVIAALQKQIKALKGKGGTTKNGLTPLPVAQLVGIVIDDEDAERTGTWTRSQSSQSYIGKGYQHDGSTGKGDKTATFRPSEKLVGEYEVRFAYTPGGNRSPAVDVTVQWPGGEKTTTINQQKNPPIQGRLVSLGRFHFKVDEQPAVTLSNQGTTGHVIIDAVQFLPVKLADKKPVAKKPTDKKPADKKQLATLEKELKVLTQQKGGRPKYMSVQEEKEITDTQVHLRGNVHNLGDSVPRGFLQVASYGPAPKMPGKQSGRLELGAWIADRQNPLTARVLVNRLWHWTFGAGLVRTTDNFGITGESPSHPELLDYLAARLLEEDWSIKAVLREMVLSQTYRLSSATSEHASAIQAGSVDPENRLLWKMNRRRLEAENLLDAMLAVGGQIQLEIGGPVIRAGTPNDYDYRHEGERRAVYWPVLRNSLPDIFQVFDFANPSMVTGRRDVSSTASQGLFMMNNPWVLEQAERAATRVLGYPGLDDSQRVNRLVRSAFGRHATAEELELMVTFVYVAGDEDTQRKLKWAQLVQALFSSLDFRYNY
ncbi:MAG: DUF1553 domain-containing protein [Pirellulaceae bacterium]